MLSKSLFGLATVAVTVAAMPTEPKSSSQEAAYKYESTSSVDAYYPAPTSKADPYNAASSSKASKSKASKTKSSKSKASKTKSAKATKSAASSTKNGNNWAASSTKKDDDYYQTPSASSTKNGNDWAASSTKKDDDYYQTPASKASSSAYNFGQSSTKQTPAVTASSSVYNNDQSGTASSKGAAATGANNGGSNVNNGQQFSNNCKNKGISVGDCSQLGNIAALNGNSVNVGGDDEHKGKAKQGSVNNGQQFMNTCKNKGVTVLNCAQLLNVALLNGNDVAINLADLTDLSDSLGLGNSLESLTGGLSGGLLGGSSSSELVKLPIGLA